MEFVVYKDSIVRRIWGKGDTILFVFAGASAEFALNKAVDWLYYTGKLPADPLGRLFSTVMYARQIVFSDKDSALQTIDKINSIHGALEKGRGYPIPAFAYRDVLYMLIHYSLASYELLERKMTQEEKEDLFDVFKRMGERMQIPDLPKNFEEWKAHHAEHLQNDMENSDFTKDLYKQYRKHLGAFRYWLLWESQKLVVPERVKELLEMRRFSWARPIVFLYKIARFLKLDGILKAMVMPAKYRDEIKSLDKMEAIT